MSLNVSQLVTDARVLETNYSMVSVYHSASNKLPCNALQIDMKSYVFIKQCFGKSVHITTYNNWSITNNHAQAPSILWTLWGIGSGTINWESYCANSFVHATTFFSRQPAYMLGINCVRLLWSLQWCHVNIMASQINDKCTVWSTVCSDLHQRKHHAPSPL